MSIPTLKIIASILQMHGPDATIQSDHQGIDALLGDVRGQISKEEAVPDTPCVTQVAFYRGPVRRFARGPVGGVFRRL